MRKNNDNTYEVSLPHDLNISLIFNVFDLYYFHEGEDKVEHKVEGVN